LLFLREELRQGLRQDGTLHEQPEHAPMQPCKYHWCCHRNFIYWPSVSALLVRSKTLYLFIR